jgi:hypothetical protein
MLLLRESYLAVSIAEQTRDAGETMRARPWGREEWRCNFVYDAPQDVKRAVLVVDGAEKTGYRGDDVVKCLAAREGAMMRDGQFDALGQCRMLKAHRNV